MSRPESFDALAPAATRSRGSIGLWFAMFGPAAAWFAGQVAGYYGVHEVCRVHSPLGPRVVLLLALVVSLAAGIVSRVILQQVERYERTRFLAQIGLLSSGVFSLIVALQIVATFLLPGCHERPRTPTSPDVLRVPTATQSLT